jgi:glycosyltransferase involved in cell wall biosynthesis
MLRTWATTVNVFIALTQFARNKFIEGGLAADKIMLKPNFVKTNGDHSQPRDDYALFVGRLSTDKGIETMLRAWRSLAGTVALKIVGDGPLLPFLAEFTKHLRGITYMGRQSSHQVHELMGRAACVVVPSEWYETFGRVIVEAFANGTPVIASRIGALAELVEHEQTGLHFEPGNHHDLIAKITWAFAHRDRLAAMGRSARRKYENGYTPRTNYELLMNIYSMAMKN